jgi:hypothetical protein
MQFGHIAVTRLTAANRNDGAYSQYSYDTVGNRLTGNDTGTTTTLSYLSNRIPTSVLGSLQALVSLRDCIFNNLARVDRSNVRINSCDDAWVISCLTSLNKHCHTRICYPNFAM